MSPDNQLKELFPSLHRVGGCVRDAMLGHEPKDIDFAVVNKPQDVINTLECEGYRVIPTGIEHGTVTAIVNDEPYEITTFRADTDCDGRKATVDFVNSIEKDLERRDFTINAMAIDADGTLVDPHGGEEDIKRRIIRCVGKPLDRFEEDFLRVIRACRFAAKLRFNIAPDTLEAMMKVADRVLQNVSIERVVAEFDKAFANEEPSRFLQLLEYTTVLYDIFPELNDAGHLKQNPKYHPEGDVWTHILEVVDRAPATHRWHALLHDIGKGATAEWFDDGDYGSHYTFIGHAAVGAAMVEEIANRLKMPTALKESLVITTKLHMEPCNVEGVTERRRRRFQVKAGKHLKDIETLCRADAGDRERAWDLFVPTETPIEPILMGRHLIETGVKPGIGMGDMLKLAFEYQINTGCKDISELLKVAKGELHGNGSADEGQS